MSDKVTARPWDYYNAWQYGDISVIHPLGEPDNYVICKLTDEAGNAATPEANAAYIVKCVNLHDELVEALTVIRDDALPAPQHRAIARQLLKKIDNEE